MKPIQLTTMNIAENGILQLIMTYAAGKIGRCCCTMTRRFVERVINISVICAADQPHR